MTNVAFDTLSASKDLQNAGIEARQAEAIALVFKNSQSSLATKADIEFVKKDIENLRTELKGDIGSLRTELKGDIKQVKADIDNLRTEFRSDIRWLKWSIVAMMAIMLGGFTAIISLFVAVLSA